MGLKRHFCGLGRRTISLGLLLLLPSLASAEQPLVDRVDMVSMTVGDIDRAVDFYSKVLTFEKVSDTEVAFTNTYRESSACGCASSACAWGTNTLSWLSILRPRAGPSQRRMLTATIVPSST